MSVLTVDTVQSQDGVTPTQLKTGNASGGAIKLEAANDHVVIQGTLVLPTGTLTGFPTVAANGISLVASGPTSTLTLVSSANVSIQANTASVNATFDLVDVPNFVPGIYGSGQDTANGIQLTVDSKGRISAIANSPQLIIRMTTQDVLGINVAAQSQNWFTTLGNVNVLGGTTYDIEGILGVVDTATTHTQSIQFLGTAVLDWFVIDIQHVDGANNTTLISSSAGSAIAKMKWEGASGANAPSVARVLNATSVIGQHWTLIKGKIRVSAPGTLNPRFQVSAVGAPIAGYTSLTIKNGTYLQLTPLSANTANLAIGPWST